MNDIKSEQDKPATNGEACPLDTLVICTEQPRIKLYNEDWHYILPRYEKNAFNLAIVDPPYRNPEENDANESMRKYINNGRLKDWSEKPGQEFFDELFRVSKNQIIWGANNFQLPNHKGFVIWKKPTISEKFTMSMCEMAFISEGLGTISKIIELNPNIIDRIHPTQKPIALYRWLLQNYAEEGEKILDTHLGSGSSAIACYEEGFDLVATEIDEDYFEAMTKRFNQHKKQGKLF